MVDVDEIEADGLELHEEFAGAGHGIGDVLEAKDFGAAVLTNANGFHPRKLCCNRESSQESNRDGRAGNHLSPCEVDARSNGSSRNTTVTLPLNDSASLQYAEWTNLRRGR
jgi:hypothetical protein